MPTPSLTNAAGISILAFIVAIGVSLVYYQFIYIPELSIRPTVPQEILEPEETVNITIVEGSSNPNNGRFYVPADTRATL